MIYNPEVINQVHAALGDVSRLLSTLLGQEVEVKVVNPPLPDTKNLKAQTSKVADDLLKHKIIELVCSQFMITPARLRQRIRKREVVDTRKAAANILMTYVKGIEPKEVAYLLNFHRSSVYHNCMRCEEMLLIDKTFLFNYNQVLHQLKKFYDKD